METVKAAREAMATRFEMVLHGENSVALRAAADEAFLEIERLHGQLNLYSTSSEVSYINAHAARHPVRVEPRLFQLLQLAKRIHEETGGAFDITIAPLMRCWGFMGGSGVMPTLEHIAEARSRVGMEHLVLDQKQSTIRFERDGMMVDLGSIGKGYALEVACEILTEAGVQSGLIHGGTSTVCAIGRPPEGEAWKVAIEFPPGYELARPESGQGRDEKPGLANLPLAVVSLENEALSVSAVHGKAFQMDGKTYGHVIDPRTGYPAQGAVLAGIVLPSATETDAFSTALLLGGSSSQERIASLRSGARMLVLEGGDAGHMRIASHGIVRAE